VDRPASDGVVFFSRSHDYIDWYNAQHAPSHINSVVNPSTMPINGTVEGSLIHARQTLERRMSEYVIHGATFSVRVLS
jgi:hypothetical protein